MDEKLDYYVKQGEWEIFIEQYVREMGNDIVDQLVEARKQAGMTQQDLADAIGLPRANVSRIERKLYTPTIAILSKYADGVGKKLEMKISDK